MKRFLRTLLFLAVIAGLAVGGRKLWMDPNVRALFQMNPEPEADPLAFLKEKTAPVAPSGRSVPKRAKRRPRHIEPVRDEEPKIISDISDKQLRHLVLQRLFTLHLHAGISVSAKNSVVYLFGAVSDTEKRKRIIDVVQHLPGVYKVDASALSIGQIQPEKP